MGEMTGAFQHLTSAQQVLAGGSGAPLSAHQLHSHDDARPGYGNARGTRVELLGDLGNTLLEHNLVRIDDRLHAGRNT